MAKQKKLTRKDVTPKEFTLRAIETLAQPGRAGIHTVYSGFNEAFRQVFPDKDPVKVCQQLQKDLVISIRPCKGGVVISKYKEGAGSVGTDETLDKMGIDA